MPRTLTLTGFERFGQLPPGHEFHVTVTPINDSLEAFVLCACGWKTAHYFPRKHSSPYDLELAIKADLKDHGGLTTEG